MKRLFIPFIAPFFLNGEPSAFDLQSGATKKELKQLQINSKNFSNILTKIHSQVESNTQAQEGLKSVYEGQSNKIKHLNDAILSQEESLRALKASQEVHANTIKQQSEILEDLRNEIRANQQAIQQLDKQNKEMSELLTKLSQDLVAQIALIQKTLKEQEKQEKAEKQYKQSAPTNEKSKQSLAADVLEQDKENQPKHQQLPKEEKNQEKEKTPKVKFHKDLSKQKEIFEEALSFFRNKSYAEAKERLLWLEANSYRLSYVRYVLGEVAYGEKKYREAIKYYKESALLNKKASYMPVLLWHTAWSFKKIKDDQNYYKFLNTLQHLYPSSEQAKMAKKILENKEKHQHAKP
ncbi:tetratricopeptide repeat protein [Helicobacter pylori]|uniref:tetratricopeptide repeat protein n=1 Tax=Helicobacter pylori TaxID=210 RepID=UPI0003F4CAF1|nr:tetratricopeptide repeat protein [Helicobacter pylori]